MIRHYKDKYPKNCMINIIIHLATLLFHSYRLVILKLLNVSFRIVQICMGFPGGSVVKNTPANAGDARGMGLIPGLGRHPEEGNGNPLQYS